MSKPPVLWQYNFSNYNEKVRWALDFKAVPHKRRSLLPMMPRALAFSSRGGTLPVLDLDGERIVDSTPIIAALEQRHPERALYPEDAVQRKRALELEDFFDEHGGHELREIAFWGVKDNPAYISSYVTTGQPAAARLMVRSAMPVAWQYVKHRYHWSEEDLKRASETVGAALDRIEAERDGGEYLVGDSFTVADLTAAAIFFPLAWPAELQYDYPEAPETELLAPFAEHPAIDWIRDTYRRHRGASAEIA